MAPNPVPPTPKPNRPISNDPASRGPVPQTQASRSQGPPAHRAPAPGAGLPPGSGPTLERRRPERARDELVGRLFTWLSQRSPKQVLIGLLAIALLLGWGLTRLVSLGGDVGRSLRSSVNEIDVSPLDSGQDAPAGRPAASALLNYKVAPGDTLSAIADRFGIPLDRLMKINGIRNADSVYVGQSLKLSIEAERDGPASLLLPDHEFVYGPAYVDFEIQSYIHSQKGALASHREMLEGSEWTGAELLERISDEFSIGPRVILSMLEMQSGALTEPGPLPDAAAGMQSVDGSNLWLQLNRLADRLNLSYYDFKTRDSGIYALSNGTYWGAHPDINAASFALQAVLAQGTTGDGLAREIELFNLTYLRLFGDPWAALESESSDNSAASDPAQVEFPRLALPWDTGERWWMTGGPHGGWATGSAWAALDFVPEGEERGCFISDSWARAVADGVIVAGVTGEIWLDIDGDGDKRTGPVVQYLHLSSQDRVKPRTEVEVGDELGHPSCEGGVSNATHLHISRMQDGEWLAAAGHAGNPFSMGPWTAWGTASAYDGGMDHADGSEREACQCRQAGVNDIQ